MNPADDQSGSALSALADFLPGGIRFRVMLLVLMVAAVAVDALWMQGDLFGGPVWRGILWLLVALGLGIGLLARFRFLRR